MRRMIACFGLLAAAHWCARAQAPPPAEQTPAAATRPRDSLARTNTYTPLTLGERTRLYFKSLIDPVDVVAVGAYAGIHQWEDTPGEWGQGDESYGWRVASSYGGHLTRETLMFGASSLLHEDNRYFPSGRTGFGARLKYAVESEFLTYRDDGTRRFAFSRMGADLGGGFISRAWQPASAASAQDAITSFGVIVAVQTGFKVAREFLPFFRRGGQDGRRKPLRRSVR